MGPSRVGRPPALKGELRLWWGSHEGSWGTSLQGPKAGGRLDFCQPVPSQGSVPTEWCLTLLPAAGAQRGPVKRRGPRWQAGVRVPHRPRPRSCSWSAGGGGRTWPCRWWCPPPKLGFPCCTCLAVCSQADLGGLTSLCVSLWQPLCCFHPLPASRGVHCFCTFVPAAGRVPGCPASSGSQCRRWAFPAGERGCWQAGGTQQQHWLLQSKRCVGRLRVPSAGTE